MDASVSEGTVEVEIRYGGVIGNVPLVADPLADCSFRGPVTRAEVLALLAISVGARVAKMSDETDYAVVICDSVRFNGSSSAVWPIDEDPPEEVIEILTQAAVARLTVPSPTPQAAPDGFETPFLVHLPVWLWLDPVTWQTRSATASLGSLGASATATATPRRTEWAPGDGHPIITCAGPGTAWGPDLPSASDPHHRSDCDHTYATITSPGQPITLSATAVYDLNLSCQPSRICNGVELPASLTVTSSRPVHVTQARGVITE